MRFPPIAAILTLGLLGLSLQAATPMMPVSELRPGMVGTGHTVFAGTRVEEFKAHILGVIENVIGTRRNLILAKLEGGPLAETGVIAGMSGSPVYIDGRLIGAVSYSLGSFSKEPIAGITPIEEMIDATSRIESRAPGSRVKVDFPLSRDGLVSSLRKALNWNRPFAERPEDASLLGLSGLEGIGGREVATMLRPIATPLVMSGFEPDLADTLGSAFRDQGFVPMGGATLRSGDMPFDGPLKPGDAVGITFINGDLEFGATGTVTHIDGDRVYAFGHPMYNLGPTEFPMTRAYVYTVIPSLMSSSKLSSTNEVIGTFLQDRATAIAGRLGNGPALLPVTMTIASAREGASRTFKFGVVRDQLFTPLMTYAAIVNTLGSYERQFGTATYSLKGKVTLKKYDAVAIDNLFAGENSSSNASASIVAPLTALINNDYENVDIDGVDLTMTAIETQQTATLERVWVDDPRPRAGRRVPVKVLLRTYRGEDLLRTIPIDIPANASGNLTVVVSDGQRLTQTEQREVRASQPRSVPQLLRALSKVRRNDTVYVKLLSMDAGAVVGGEVLPSLPPSVLAVLEADRTNGSYNPLNSATLGEWSLQTDHAVSGVRALTIQVSAN